MRFGDGCGIMDKEIKRREGDSMNCPVCGKKMVGLVCDCGYDRSRDYELYPTFGSVPRGMESVAVARVRRSNLFSCVGCGYHGFTMARDTGEMKCIRCGQSPMEKELKSVIDRLNKGREELKVLDAARGRKKRELDSLSEQLGGLQEKLSELLSMEYKKKLELKALDGSIDKKRSELDAANEQVYSVQNNLQELALKERASKAELNDVERLMDTKSTMLSKANVRMAAVNQRLDELLNQRSIMERKLSELNQQLSQKKLELDLLYTQEKAQMNRSEGTDSFSDAESMLEFLGVPRKPRIKAIAANHDVTVAAYTNGTVKVIGKVGFSWAAVGEWRNIASVAVCDKHIFGLTNQGTVLCTGKGEIPRVISKWEDIIAISANRAGVFGLTRNGSVLAAKGGVKKNDLAKWSSIKAISAGHEYIVGLKRDGTVVAAGRNDKGQCEVTDWRDVVYISAGTECTVGLKADGSAVNTGHKVMVKSPCLAIYQSNCQYMDETDSKDIYGLLEDHTVWGFWGFQSCNEEVRQWSDIVELVVISGVIIGLKKDGTVVSVWAKHRPSKDVSELNRGVV